MHAWEEGNFDAYRYQGMAPDTFFLTQHAQYLSNFVDHWESFFRARQLLADETSRTLFDRLILFRLLGHLHVRLPMSNPETLARIAVPDDWVVSETTDKGLLGPLSIFTVPVGDDLIWLKRWAGNISAYLAGQYYFDRDSIQIQPEAGDHAIDAGGCFGDTAAFFAHRVGASGRVYTFDPLKKHCAIMREAFILNGPLGDRITIFEAGLSDADETGVADSGSDINPGARVGHASGLTLRSIDSVVAAGEVSRVDFIKMDIEGSELAALQGGEAAIRKWRPKLAISLYHRPEDFYAIPKWIDSLDLGYRFYLDHYSIHHEETVLYAVSK
jgi:FkbM family methyltransferase